ncbi:peptidase E [Protaetiibacter mangrovi]|uniref:Peptidase E n=1 Tax=Protaetiibacter mangrovi TaxID=2970926 RepID=A0ABT1ZEP0_9MICO|nr:peptidase E [Protaetiibacter mangrovi]MCS0499173.1 peptidase E [Protaetiibacter mangrovi]
MRMMLTSNGITNGTLQAELAELLGKPFAEARIVYVLDAILPFPGDKGSLIRDLNRMQGLGWAQFDVMSLAGATSALLQQRLRDADVVYCFGGSNHWLARAWRGHDPMLAELLTTTVYVGMSAGSMIFSRRHTEAAIAFGDTDELAMLGLALDEVSAAVPLFDWVVIAHRGADFMGERYDERAIAAAARFGGEVWFLDDASGLVIRDPDADPELVTEGDPLHLVAGVAV